MNFKLSKISNIKKLAAGTAAAIGLSTLGFGALTQSAQAAGIDKTITVPTTYSSTVSDVTKVKIPDGYVKANYQIKIDGLAKPSEKEITAEKAAELGAQDLWRLFKADLSNKSIEMSYAAVNEHHPRAEWLGVIKVDETLFYLFSIDTLTGELRNTGIERYLPGNVDTGMDKALMKNPGKYLDLAKQTAEKFHLVTGKIASVEYASQGYCINHEGTGKNAQIAIIVTSENGEQAQLEFSKVNQEFLNVSYDRAMKDFQEFAKQAEKQAKERAQKRIIISQDSEGKLVADEEK